MAYPRANSRKRGYTKRWEKARAVYVLLHPYCVPCEKAGLVAAVKAVHHKIPRRVDEGLFWDESNWESRCLTCHADAQKVEQAHESRAETYRGCGVDGKPLDPAHHWNGGSTKRTPRFSRPYIPRDVPAIGGRLTVVCGAPRSGKTTWARDQAREHGGLVVDLDDFAGTLDERYEQRDQLLTAAAHSDVLVWFVIGAPRLSQRAALRRTLKPGRVVVLETPKEVCLERANGDPRARIPAAIVRWWQEYEPGEKDERLAGRQGGRVTRRVEVA